MLKRTNLGWNIQISHPMARIINLNGDNVFFNKFNLKFKKMTKNSLRDMLRDFFREIKTSVGLMNKWWGMIDRFRTNLTLRIAVIQHPINQCSGFDTQLQSA